MKIIDISPPITEKLSVWPGAPAYTKEMLLDVDQGDHLSFSKITTNLHLGAHVDGPNHYAEKQEGIGERSLHYYVGDCQVLYANTPVGERVQLSHLSTQKIAAPRVLIRTLSFPDPNNWNSDFCSLSVELIESFAEQQAILVGIDTPSIDPEDCKELPAHKAVAKNNMAILEGIVLKDVKEGVYQLSALPLPLVGADASPVRAVLFSTT